MDLALRELVVQQVPEAGVTDVPARLAPHVAAAIVLYAHRQERNGVHVPGLEALAYRLVASENDAMIRRRELWAAASRRYRARKRRSRAA